MKTYHYCAMSVTPGGQHYSSGVFTRDGSLGEPGAYEAVCREIGSRMSPPREFTDLALLSLTVIADDACDRATGPACIR